MNERLLSKSRVSLSLSLSLCAFGYYTRRSFSSSARPRPLVHLSRRNRYMNARARQEPDNIAVSPKEGRRENEGADTMRGRWRTRPKPYPFSLSPVYPSIYLPLSCAFFLLAPRPDNLATPRLLAQRLSERSEDADALFTLLRSS